MVVWFYKELMIFKLRYFFVFFFIGCFKWKKMMYKSVLDNESDDDGLNMYDYDDSFLDDEEFSISSFFVELVDDFDW